MKKYEEVYRYIVKEIEEGRLRPGDKIPSVRKLSEQFHVNKSTVLAAFQQATNDQWIYSIPQSGYYVLQPHLRTAISTNQTFDFATASPTWHSFPYDEFKKCVTQALDLYSEEFFKYGTQQGMNALVDAGQKLLEEDQIFAQRKQLFVTGGVQQALYILTHMQFPNEKREVLVEEPSYHLYLNQLRVSNVMVSGVRRTMDGLDMEQVEQLFASKRFKFFYTMPRFHNPLGNTLSSQQKKQLLELAEFYDVYLVEDDYLADFEYRSRQYSLYSEDSHQRVIYLKSFSKIMFPGLRTGLVVLPQKLTQAFQRFKNALDIESSMISQAALTIYIENGMFSHYKTKVKKEYHSRGVLLQKAMQKNFHTYSCSSDVIMHGSVEFPKNYNLPKLIESLLRQNIKVEEASQNFIHNQAVHRLLKLNVSNLDPSFIEEGIQRIASELPKHRFL